MNRICPGGLVIFEEPPRPPSDQMSGECRYGPNSNDVIFAFDLPGNRNIRGLEIGRPIIRRQHDGRDCLQRLALLGIRFSSM